MITRLLEIRIHIFSTAGTTSPLTVKPHCHYLGGLSTNWLAATLDRHSHGRLGPAQADEI